MTPEQAQALALAAARRRRAQAESAVGPSMEAELGPMQGPQQPIEEGNWDQLNQRLNEAAIEIAPGTMGPVSPDQMAQQRLQAAISQGVQYGQSRPEAETAFRAGVDAVPYIGPSGNFMEALTSGTASGMTFPERHEFIKAADAGRAMRNPKSAAGGTVAGILAGALAMRGMGGPVNTYGQAMRSGSITGATDAGVRELINTRGDLEAVVPAAAGGAAFGGIGGAGGKLISDAGGAAINKIGRIVTGGKPSIPTNEALRKSAEAAYNRAEQAGVIIAPSALQRTVSDLSQELADFGYHPKLQPRVGAVLEEMAAQSQGNITLKGVDVLKRIAGGVAKSTDPSEAALGVKIIGKLDDMLGTLQPDDIIGGDAKAGMAALGEGRKLWRQFRASEGVDEAIESARLRAGSTGSGGNVDNAIRQNIRKLLESGKGYTEAERAAMERVVMGPGQKTLRTIGKMSPSGNGLMAALGIGATATNPAMAAFPAAGIVAKALADRATVKNVEALSSIIRAGGPEAAEGVRLLDKLPKAARDAVVNALINTGAIGGGMAGATAGPAVYGAFGGQ